VSPSRSDSDGDICKNIKGTQLQLPEGKMFELLEGKTITATGNCIDAPYAFSKIVLEKVSRDSKEATFNITLTYNPDIFNDTKEIQLLVPTGIQTNQSNLFEVKT
jgi:hypothetical protein